MGKAIEDRLLPFETSVTRVASTERTDDRGRIHGIAELHALLPEHDIVVVGVPLSDSTRHLIDDAFLAARIRPEPGVPDQGLRVRHRAAGHATTRAPSGMAARKASSIRCRVESLSGTPTTTMSCSGSSAGSSAMPWTCPRSSVRSLLATRVTLVSNGRSRSSIALPTPP